MPDALECWDPNDWEQYVLGLLQDRHGPLNVMKVPARHLGDLGLDYYCLSDRVVYQCYAVQEPCDVADRAQKQKIKITADLNKFCGNKDGKIAELLGPTKIDRWILVVPLHDSVQVNSHLTQKTGFVTGKQLSYVSNNFEALIHDLQLFDPQSITRRNAARALISLPPLRPTSQEIDACLLIGLL
jgi:hypothetical protein